MSNEGPAVKKVLRQSPGIKFEVKSKTIERISPQLKAVERISKDLKEEPSNKKTKPGSITTSDATFTAYDQGTYYTCHAEVTPDGGPHDWYLINWLTGVYTYIGTTADYYIDFNVQKPSMYGNYRLWAEGPMGAGYTGYEYLGDPYSGVSMVGGIMSFTDTSAMNVIEARIEAAMENHLANFADPLNYMSEDAYNDYADNVGFDEFLPMREFEAYFGHYSLRKKIEDEELAWLASSPDPWLVSPHPDDLYAIEDELTRVFRNQYSQMKVGSVVYEPLAAIESPSIPISCSERSGYCTNKAKNADWEPLPDGKRIHYKVVMRQSEADNSENANNVVRAYFKGKIRCYKKKGVLFSKRRTQMMVRIQGTAYTTDIYSNPCGVVHHNFDENAPLRRSYHRDKEKRYRTNNIHVKTCQSFATFTVGSYTFTKPLN